MMASGAFALREKAAPPIGLCSRPASSPQTPMGSYQRGATKFQRRSPSAGAEISTFEILTMSKRCMLRMYLGRRRSA